MSIDSLNKRSLENDFVKTLPKLSILEKLYLLLLVITSGTDLSLDSSLPLYCLMFVFLLLIATRRIDIRICGKQLIFSIIVFVIWLIQCINYYSDMAQLHYVVKYTALLASTLLFSAGTKNKTKECFEQLIKFIFAFALISSMLFFLVVIGVNLPTIFTSTHQTLSVFYLEHYSANTVYGLWGFRNSGIYWEPGMYQIYLNLMLVFFLFNKDDLKPIKRHMIVAFLVILILTTGSISGYILCSISIAIYALINSNSVLIKTLIAILSIAVLFILVSYVDTMIYNKLNMGHSYQYRLNDIIIGIELFKTKPIFGFGIINDKYAHVFMDSFGILRGNTNGVINILINFGIIGLIFYIIQLFKFLKFIAINFSKKMVLPLIAWLLISLNTEPIATHAFVFYLISIGLCQSSTVRFTFGKHSK